ncbi:UNVERIFIED_CONTAM: hypothetical protein Slati_2977600 [Sesamum latifolium]|uniref:Integrase catalytic domain-containing protein n=1 Tax=Sesamum latifolium TaxID=2727402 RepID=A0AAW2VFV9_9LAMI
MITKYWIPAVKLTSTITCRCWKEAESYQSEAFERLKEFRLEVENQTDRKIKTIRSDQREKYLSGEFIDYLKKNGLLSQWTPSGTPQLNDVVERKNRTLLHMVRSMMSFIGLTLSFYRYAFETEAKVLNMAPSNILGKGVFLKIADEIKYCLKSQMRPQQNDATSFVPMVSSDSVPVLRRSAKVSQPPDRYGFLGLTSQLDNDPSVRIGDLEANGIGLHVM